MKRILTAAIAVPLALAVTLYAPNWLFALLVAGLAGLMLDEYLELTVAGGYARPGRWFLVPGGMVAASFAAGGPWIVTSVVLAALSLMASGVFATPGETALSRVSAGLSGVVYCSFLFGFL